MKIAEIVRQPPVKALRVVYHVGTLDVRQKSNFSHEGRGLSVSLHPDEWQKIARGQVSGDLWKLENPQGRFLNFHAWRRNPTRAAIKWGVEAGLIILKSVFRAEYEDDDIGETMYVDFDSIEAARAEGYETAKKLPASPTMTSKLAAYMGWRQPELTMSLDALAVAYSDHLGLDGVWWQDKLDVGAYSAPRGVILPNRIRGWKRTLLAPKR